MNRTKPEKNWANLFHQLIWWVFIYRWLRSIFTVHRLATGLTSGIDIDRILRLVSVSTIIWNNEYHSHWSTLKHIRHWMLSVTVKGLGIIFRASVLRVIWLSIKLHTRHASSLNTQSRSVDKSRSQFKKHDGNDIIQLETISSEEAAAACRTEKNTECSLVVTHDYYSSAPCYGLQ